MKKNYVKEERMRCMRKLICKFTIVLLAVIVINVRVNAEELEINGITYKTNDDASCYVADTNRYETPEKIKIPATIQIEGKTYMVTEIDTWAFLGNKSIKEIELPYSIVTIGEQAFSGMSNLTNINIPANTKKIGSLAFEECISLKRISISNDNQYYCADSYCNIYNKDMTILEFASPSAQKNVIPEGVKSLNYAFRCNQVITEITIPGTVEVLDINEFSGCSNLQRVTLKEGIRKICEGAFNYCTSLQTINFPEGLTHIGEKEDLGGVFVHCDSLKEITLPSTLKYMGMNAFFICGNLRKAVIYSRHAEIDSYAFSDCNSDLVIYGYSNSTWAERFSCFRPLDGPKVKGTTLNVSAQKCKVKVTSSSAKAPTVSYIKSTNSKAKTITIPDTVKVDGITYKVTSVVSNALANNKKVTKVTVGKNVTSIGKNAFKKCTKLKTVILKSTSLKSIGSNAFYGDKNLKTITIKSTKLISKSVGKNAFKGTNKKLTIKVPKKKVSSYKKFLGKRGNKNVKVKK